MPRQLARIQIMPTLKSSSFPPPRSWEEFEILCADLFRHVWKDPGTQRNGRTGQPQHGVDVFGRPDGGPHYAGAQARNKTYPPAAVTVVELRAEVEKAKKFVPALKSFILATTAPNDARPRGGSTADGGQRSSWPVLSRSVGLGRDCVEDGRVS